MTPEDRSRRQRNIVLGLMLAVMAALFYAITVARMGS